MAIEGEAYHDKEFRDQRYKHLKELGTPKLTKRSTVEKDPDTGKWTNVWIIEYEVEDVKGDGDLLGAGLLKPYPGNKLLN